MAIGNASVGINHALAHALGAIFHIPHGKANSVFLLSTLAYNSKIPQKFTAVSTYPLWIADEKYARAAQFLNLPFEQSDADKQDQKAKAIENKSIANSRELRKQALILTLRRAVFDLLETCGQAKSIVELGIDEQAFRQALPELTRLAFNDLSIRTAPNLPLQEEVVGSLLESYPLRTRP